MKWVFKHQDLQMFGLKLNKYEYFSNTLKLWDAVARHNFNPFRPKFTIVIFIH